ncbi:MAG: thioredoxin domain-containing protein [Flavobacteriales bacterium]|nr:thioredoxin domain-containing protein [Flavobacteriales bacterium]
MSQVEGAEIPANALINESSPYLLQHAHNPVHWHPWSDHALQLARDQNRLMVISIGYSACHWCHVMERESFEDLAVAAVMNAQFVNIKVDREERPDIDHVYMTAVQLMAGRGGWPLNCIALPDGRPLYGGTYFPRAQWLRILQDVAKLWESDPERALEYATELTHGVQQADLLPVVKARSRFTAKLLKDVMQHWHPHLDNSEGGSDRAPKFPMPANYMFLLRQANLTDDLKLMAHVHLTLRKMAFGGIFDQVGGGFSRYSVDPVWKVPHFEKMLYDNAQLVSLYSEAFRASGRPLYGQVVEQTLDFIAREMTSPEGAFYSALDADSEGEEGKFYVWTAVELQELLGADFEWVKDYYNINSTGLWEHDNHILLRTTDDKTFAAARKWTVATLQAKVKKVNGLLLKRRGRRVRPGLDDKQLTSWNALMLKGYADAYRAFGKAKWLEAALRNADFLLKVQRRDDGGLWHGHKNGRSTVNGFLEDYCFSIEALIALYQVTFDRHWLDAADGLAQYAITHFMDAGTGMFHVASDLDPKLFAKKMELSDNVIPSSNSSMANGLFLLGHLLGNEEYLEMSDRMLGQMLQLLPQQGAWHANWCALLLRKVHPFHEVAVVGPDALDRRAELDTYYRPNMLLLGGVRENGLPLLKGRAVIGRTYIYVCVDKACMMPTEDVIEAVGLLV